MSPLQRPPTSLLDKFRGADFEPIYATSVTVTGGEAEHGRTSGVARSDDGNLQLDLRLPEGMGGPGGGTNPEQLFAAAYGACFHGALNLIAAKHNIEVTSSRVIVSVAFGRDPVDGLFMLTADVSVALPGLEKNVATELVRQAERNCPYTKMVRQGIVGIVALDAP